MIFEIRRAWIGVDLDLRSPGPFSIYFVREDSQCAYLTSYPHFIFWNGFLINSQPCTGFNETVLLAKKWYDDIRTVGPVGTEDGA